jgi:hypothetical protein
MVCMSDRVYNNLHSEIRKLSHNIKHFKAALNRNEYQESFLGGGGGVRSASA